MFTVHRPGRMRWRDARELQASLAARVQADRREAHLVLVEHEPVLTLGRNAKPGNLLVEEAVLRARGIEVERCDRGGDVTWHGPGQVVGYPILHLPTRKLGVAAFVHALESAMTAACAEFGVAASPGRGAIGVWAGEAKIGSIGIHVSRGVTTHGFALNACPDLSAFSLINPCGVAGCPVTSLSRETGRPVGWQAAADALEAALAPLAGPSRPPEETAHADAPRLRAWAAPRPPR